MLAILENVSISGHHQFVIVGVLQLRVKGRILVTNFSKQNNKDKDPKFVTLHDINRTCLFYNGKNFCTPFLLKDSLKKTYAVSSLT